MNKNQRLLTDVYDEVKENIYLSESILDNDKLMEMKDDLLNLHEYLPNLIRFYFEGEYRNTLSEEDKDIINELYNTRNYTREENVIECINWVDNHKDFKDLLNEGNIQKIGNLLEDLEKEYNTYFNKLK